MEVFAHIQSLKADSIIVAGDFNTVMQSSDIRGGRGIVILNAQVY